LTTPREVRLWLASYVASNGERLSAEQIAQARYRALAKLQELAAKSGDPLVLSDQLPVLELFSGDRIKPEAMPLPAVTDLKATLRILGAA
jgi:hypothetical protein